MKRHVFGSVNSKFKSHVRQCTCYYHSAVKFNGATLSSVLWHRCFCTFRCGYVEAWVHRVARKLYIAAVLNSKCFERDYRKRVFHLSVVQGVSSGEHDVIGRIILQTQVASSCQIDIIWLVGIDITYNVCTACNANCHVYIKSGQCRTTDGCLCRVIEICEFYKFIKPVVIGQGRVAQDICHVCGSENVQFSTHLQVVHRTVYHAEEIDKGFSECDAVDLFLGVYYLIVLRFHPKVHLHVTEIGEIDVAIKVKRIVVVREHLKVFKQQVASHYAYRVVAETQLHPVRNAYKIRWVEEDLTVYLRFVQCPLDFHRTVGISLETDYAVWYETVDEWKRKTFHIHSCIKRTVVLRGVGSDDASHFHAVVHQHTVYIVRTVFFRHIHEFCCNVAHGIALVCHAINR